ncbi:hypothetical protein T484DRAFT_1828453 [Baffinella frigidus]|nr:hypothetical protein T484DRAFT_1828453 [Cryptophyta sp. CCMP2293]
MQLSFVQKVFDGFCHNVSRDKRLKVLAATIVGRLQNNTLSRALNRWANTHLRLANAHTLMQNGIQRMQHDLRRLAWDEFIGALKETRTHRRRIVKFLERSNARVMCAALDEWLDVDKHKRRVENLLRRVVQRLRGNTLRDLWDWFVNRVQLSQILSRTRNMLQTRLVTKMFEEMVVHTETARKHHKAFAICTRRSDSLVIKGSFATWTDVHQHVRKVQTTVLRALQRMTGNTTRLYWDHFSSRVRFHRIVQRKIKQFKRLFLQRVFAALFGDIRRDLKHKRVLANIAARTRVVKLRGALSEWHHAARHERHVINVMRKSVQQWKGKTLRNYWDCFVARVDVHRHLRFLTEDAGKGSLRRIFDTWVQNALGVQEVRAQTRNVRVLAGCTAKSDAKIARWALDEWRDAHVHKRHVQDQMVRAVQRLQGNALRDYWDWFRDHINLHKAIRRMVGDMGSVLIRKVWDAIRDRVRRSRVVKKMLRIFEQRLLREALYEMEESVRAGKVAKKEVRAQKHNFNEVRAQKHNFNVLSGCTARSDAKIARWAYDEWRHAHVQDQMVRAVQRLQGNALRDCWDWFRDHINLHKVWDAIRDRVRRSRVVKRIVRIFEQRLLREAVYAMEENVRAGKVVKKLIRIFDMRLLRDVLHAMHDKIRGGKVMKNVMKRSNSQLFSRVLQACWAGLQRNTRIRRMHHEKERRRVLATKTRFFDAIAHKVTCDARHRKILAISKRRLCRV